MSKTGEVVQDSGTYKCIRCGNEITAVKGEVFPPCKQCRGTDFVLSKKTT
jgi:DNA-directed RNA polymerase subunit RPC12/RpoP